MSRRNSVDSMTPQTSAPASREITPETESPPPTAYSTSFPPRQHQSLKIKVTPRRRQVSSSMSSKRTRVRSRKDSTVTATEPPPSSSLTSPLEGAAVFVLSFVVEVVRNTFSILKKPLSYIIVLYFLAIVLSFMYSFASHSILSALSPLCALPMVSSLNLPFCLPPYGGDGANKRRDGKKGGSDFPRLITLQTNFETILENSVGGSTMAFDLKNTEVAVRDLSTLVRYSQLLCRDDLSDKLDSFVVSAKSASRSLTRFSSRVGGTVDSLLAMDEFAIRALENAQALRIAESAGPSIISWVIAPFRTILDITETESDILTTFIQASSMMDASIQRLIIEAEAVLYELNGLDNRLKTIEEMVAREGAFMGAKQDEVLGKLWTKLGGNRKQLSSYASHRSLLENIAVYRTKALAHVSSSLIKLQQMQSDLEELRDKVGRPGLLDMPLEVHIDSIRKGVARLNLGRSKAKDKENEHLMKMLSAHDEAIRAFGAENNHLDA